MDARGAAAACLLASILTCSALGSCWRQFVQAADDCCDRESAGASGNACASVAAHVDAVSVAAPFCAALSFATMPAALASRAAGWTAILPAKSPPLVLRI
jgi:hypothetical protein